MGRNRGEQREQSDDLGLLLALLPPELRRAISGIEAERILEVVLDLGRLPEVRLVDGEEVLSQRPIDRDMLDQIASRIGPFSEDNRAGVERTLHRISAIRNRQGDVVGLTLRVGRAIFGTIDTLRDLVESGRNILLVGPPGVGKTTKLREVARVLADDVHRRVMVVDTSNEIGGDGDVPHPGIGRARRMQVPRPDRQHSVMIEAVENHMPEVVVVDEIGTEAEALAARTIAERGVQLVATAHGNTLENLVLNPTLSDLVGGVHTVTLSDEEARRRGTQKTVNERRSPPTFDVLVEMLGRDELVVHRNTADAVDRLLAGATVGGEQRRIGTSGSAEIAEVPTPALLPPPEPLEKRRRKRLNLHPWGIGRDVVARVLRDLRLDLRLVERATSADVILASRARVEEPKLQQVLEDTGAQLIVVRRNTTAQIRRALQGALLVTETATEEEVREAVAEMEHAIRRAMSENVDVELAPRRPAVRRLQHRIATRYHLEAQSVGSEPRRHLVVHPPG